jgi:hypothetical protein
MDQRNDVAAPARVSTRRQAIAGLAVTLGELILVPTGAWATTEEQISRMESTATGRKANCRESLEKHLA